MGSKLNELLGRKRPELHHVKCYLEEEKHAALSKFCKSQGKSMSAVLNALVDDLLNDRKVIQISSVPRMLGGEEEE